MELLLTLVLLGQGMVSGPTGVELEKLWDISVQLPGTTEPLSMDGGAPVPCGVGVVFRGKEFSVPQSWAYFATSNSLEVFVDEETVIPGTSETFSGQSDIACSGGGVLSFVGSGMNPVPGGAFVGSPGGALTLVLSNGVTVDGFQIRNWEQVSVGESGSVLLGHRDPAFLGTALVFEPAGADPIYVADFDTVLPGQTAPVDSYNSPRMVGAGFVFRALTMSTRGLYHWSPADGFSLLVDSETSVPGAPGTFVGVGPITVLSDGVAFSAGFSGGVGIFLTDLSGQVEALVIPGDETVDGEVILTAFTPRGSGSLVAFRGVSNATAPREAVFVRMPDDSIRRIIAEGEMLDGKSADRVFYNADDRTVALRVDTYPPNPDDTDQRVYRATFGDLDPVIDVPALTSGGILVLVLSILGVGLWTLWQAKCREREFQAPR